MGKNPSAYHLKIGQYPTMSEHWKERIRAAIEAKGLSMKAVSLQAGKGETFVRDMLERDRAPSIDNFAAVAKALNMSVSELLDDAQPAVHEPGLRRVVVAAHVQAGHFAETWEWERDDQYAVYVPDLPEFRQLRLYGAETRGPSMNRRYAEQTVIIFNDVTEAHEQPIVGKRYVVERRRPSGEVEHTVKLLHADKEGKFWLMPESDDPRYQAPIAVEDGTRNEDSVTIIGRVLFAVTRE
ncbi:XRE family transcriptional regulator [Rhizobiaceae bacterium n13]|uniref:S24 family peptidase n=1 Tax=Ferirhizobium litorale TaxID=2927786 RepID=UPI0024B2BF54|nr:S24 family peptidase [Fererhizobium litorale]MDI7862565.1 XRE family transcriptional regulator [Fererhizobium litorale]